MTTFYVQPKFDSRISSLAMPLTGHGHGPLKRGFMIWDKKIGKYNQRATVHYLYNPSTVQATYTVGQSNFAAQLSQLYPIANEQANLVIPMTQTANWTIMFDRTYELQAQADNNSNDINDVKVAGVGVDVLQMMQFTGMLYSSGGSTASNSAAQNGVWPGVMQLIPSYAYFGGTGTNTVRYYGYISEWDVTYTHWTQNMVPMRCVVDVSWTMLPKPANSRDPSNTSDNFWINQRHPAGPGTAANLNAANASGVAGR